VGRLYGWWARFRGWPRWAQIATVVLLLIAIISAATSGGNKSTKSPSHPAVAAGDTTTQEAQAPTTTTAPPKPSIPKSVKDARSYIAKYGADANRVQANIQVVQITVVTLQKSPTQDALNQVAIQAQTAHDNLDAIRADFAGGFGSDELGSAELEVFSAADDLKNSMGALVAYTGDPNPATLAHFNAQYHQGISEWNNGVRTIWRLAKRAKPPVL
jgi:hypothetical protein